MTLQTPVRPLQLNRLQPLASYGWFAPFVVIGWLYWQPQRLAQYESQGTQSQRLRRLPSSNTWNAWRDWFRFRPMQGDLLLVCLTVLVILTALICFLSWQCVAIAVPAAGNEDRLGLLFFGLAQILVLSSLIFVIVPIILVELRSTFTRPIGSALLVALFASIILTTSLVGFDVVRTKGNAIFPYSPVLYGTFVALLVGVWVGTTFAYFGYIEHTIQILLLESGLAGVAFGALTTGLFFLAGRAVPVLTWAETLVTLMLAILLAAVAYALGILRPDQWLFKLVTSHRFTITQNATKIIPYVTPLPTRKLSDLLEDWLDTDQWLGLRNVWVVWDNTRQNTTVGQVVRSRLARHTDVDTAFRSVTLIIEQRINERGAMTASDWSIFFATRPDPPPLNFMRLLVSRKGKKKTKGTRTNRRQELRSRRWVTLSSTRYPLKNLPTSAPYQAIAAAFWYLQYGYASDALRILNGLPVGGDSLRELRQIASALMILWNVEGVTRTSTPVLPSQPQQSMWPGTWIVLDNFIEVCQLGWLYLRLFDANQRTWCMRKAYGLLQTNRQMASARAQMPPAGTLFLNSRTGLIESRFLRGLSREWLDALRSWEGSPSIPAPRSPIANPFEVTQPIPAIHAGLLVGRELDLAQLLGTWTEGSLQSTVLFGPPLIGKSSLLSIAVKAAQPRSQIISVVVNSGSTLHPPATSLLLDICERICEAAGTSIVDRDHPLWVQDPQEQFQVSFSNAMRGLGNQPVIIVVDSIDEIEDAAFVPNRLTDCLGLLLRMQIRHPRVVFTFVTRLPRRYWIRTNDHPLLRYCRFLRVSPFSTFSPVQSRQTRRIEIAHRVANIPLRSSPLRFDDNALDALFRLAGGHPYLMKALAHSAVNNYNIQTQLGSPSFLFTTAELIDARQQPLFSSLLSNYGEAILDSLGRLLPPGRRGIIHRLLGQLVLMRQPIQVPQLIDRFSPAIADDPRPDEIHYLIDCIEELGLIQRVPRFFAAVFVLKMRLFWEWYRTR